MSEKRALGADHIVIYRTGDGWELRLDTAPSFEGRELDLPGQNSFQSFDALIQHIKENIRTD
ncbi:hypothetical protein IB024_01320 [Brucella sp. 6810]|uniref:hypothetical protein n=1 Tax=Brucella sp. 6810 TaxID=2769351 RepID=UPI00165B447B|nr:hypothetical protein [Brucella sp. 6810]QNQ62429.1 hypothetical protein IB024_01320 [Brucella sp. 6810]